MSRARSGAGSGHVSVNNDRCRRYGLCHAEAPEIFQLTARGELRYTRAVALEQLESVRSATRCCPTMAILLEER